MSTEDKRENKKIPDAIKGGGIIYVCMILLFIFTLLTLYIALALVSVKTNNSNSAMTENMWRFFLVLPIPLASLILGIIYKRKGFKTTKNIVAGIIFTLLLSIYGSFTFIFSGMYSHDYSYVNRIETEIGLDLPDSGIVTTQRWSSGVEQETQTDIVEYLFKSDITFTNEAEIQKFNTEIGESSLWLASVSTPLMGEIPAMFSYLTLSDQYDCFMIYNADLDTYNSIPEKSGTYRFAYIAYDSQNAKMVIGEYNLKVNI